MKCEDKYAPTNLNEVIYPSIAVERRIKAYAAGQLEGHVMLYGPNGTGKTTVANLLVRAIGGEDARQDDCDFEELLAKPQLRDYLRNAAAFARISTIGKHFLVLNEFDYAKRGVNKLWTALDECGEDVMAIITTNNPMSIGSAVRSRFDMIELGGISAQAALPRIQYALNAEGVVLPDAQVLHYLKQIEHFMDMRKYFKKADELVFLHGSGSTFPAWSAPAAPALKVV